MAAIFFRFLAIGCLLLPVWAGAATLRVVTTDTYPPYVNRTPNGELEGYAVDIWRLWEKKTGIQVALTASSWADAQRSIRTGQADVIDLIFRTPARESLYDYSPPFAVATAAIYADASISGLHDPQDLKGFMVGAQEGDACVEKLEGAGISSVRTFPTYAALIGAVSDRSVKIFCLDEYPADYYLYRLGLQQKFVKAFDLYRDQFRRAVRKGDTQTLATVNRGMALITAEEDAALREKWMGRPVIFTEYAKRFGQVLIVLALVILGLLVWLRSVRKAVRSRTVELEREKAHLRTLVENSPDVIWLKDRHGVYLACNLPGARLLGREQDDIIGKSDFELFDKAAAEQYRRNDRLALESARPVATEESAVFNDASVHLLETIRTAIIKPDGEVLGILGVARDITERRRQERTIREQGALLREMSGLARIGAWEFDLVTGHVVWTSELARLHETAEGGPRTIPDCLSYYRGEYRAKVEEALTKATSNGEPCDMEVEMVTERGNRKWVRVIARTVVQQGRVVKVRGTMQDVTERRKLEDSMRMANLIYQTSSEATAVTDEANNIVDVNPAFLRQTGDEPAKVIGRKPRMFSSDMHDAAFYQSLWQELGRKDHWQGEIWDRNHDGTAVARLVNIRVIRHRDGRVYRHVIQFYDITAQKRKDELIWKQSNFDSLTGLPNRRLFLDRLEQEIKKAHKAGTALGLMFIDLDRFKQINDTFGRAKGDRVLLEVARRLARCVPDTATLARLEGNAFAIVMSAFEMRPHLEMVAEAVIEAVSVPLAVDDGGCAYVSASVGIALYPDDGSQAEELIKSAEQAMYLAKNEGRGRFNYFSRSLQREAQTKLTLTNDLRHALARKELQVYYQPIVEVASGRIRKAEALLRWNHPIYGTVSPARFIPLAEESGLILEIGDWVFQEAIASIGRWRDRFGSVVEVSVNNSPLQFEQPGQCRWMERFLRTGLPRNSITVEITEGVLVKDSEQVRGCLKRLHDTGVKVSIDDFGTGFSALAYLKHFDVDYLKIDKSFIDHLTEDDSDKALTEAIIDMAHKLGIEAIAEGVETSAQRDMLAVFGCDYIQGYLYSRPVPREIFELLLEPSEAH
jgi:diguanylate cyclase (GGDEF)-like protein/PAS domain S-box-containing protein